jgi:hypothetical protein
VGSGEVKVEKKMVTTKNKIKIDQRSAAKKD